MSTARGTSENGRRPPDRRYLSFAIDLEIGGERLPATDSGKLPANGDLIS
jgi:hypothetical protein